MTVQPKGEIGIKTVDGRIVPVLDFQAHRCNHTIFTTIADRQKSAVFEFFYRNDLSSQQWFYLDSLPLPRIPPAKAGEPNLSVKAQVDRHGNLTLEILDPAAKKPYAFVLKAETLADRYGELTKESVHGRPSSLSAQGKAPAAVKNKGRKGIGGRLMLLLFMLGLIVSALFFGLRPASFAARRDREPEKQKTEVLKKVEQIPAVNSLKTDAEDSPEKILSSITKGEEYSSPETDLYSISWGDTLWRITERFYEDRSVYPQLADINQISDPDFIVAGETLSLPPELSGKKRSDSVQE